MTLFRHAVMAAAIAFCPAASSAAPPSGATDIAATIKADVAEIIAGINARDIAKATRFDAPDLVSMESMREPSIGAASDREGLAMAFKYGQGWHLRLIDETVDVAKAGDMATYRSTYDEDSLRDGVPFTHRVNFLAGFKRDADGQWRIHWSVVCAQSASHKK